MASVSRTFTRLAVSFARQTSRPTTRPCPTSRTCPLTTQQRTTRQFSITPFRPNEPPKESEPAGETAASAPKVTAGETSESALEEFNEEDELDPKIVQELEQDAAQLDKEVPINFTEGGRKPRMGFWGMDEDDDMAQVEDEEIRDDAITSMAHAELIEHREQREYARVIAWDMPSLASTFPP